MKFGKSLSSQIEETIPAWRDKFLSYKDLKKRLKLILPRPPPPPPAAGDADAEDGGGERCSKRPRLAEGGMTQEEADFIRLLEDELEKFNAFFVEKEEEYIIRQKELQDRVAMARARESNEEVIKIRKEIVDFHGEMVLLENYSALNYTGLVKILKKYDKRTGALIRLPFIQKVLQEPFFTTDLLYALVKECEAMLDSLFASEASVSGASEIKSGTDEEKSFGGLKDLGEIEHMEGLYMKSTMSALRSLKEIRSKSSTVSVFSLPPLQGNGMEEIWNKMKVSVLEQTAKT